MFSRLGASFNQPPSYKRKNLYKIGDVLGAGTYGIVRRAVCKDTGEEVAIKIILKGKLRGGDQMILDELRFLKNIHHEHIIAFKDWFESKEKFYIVTQLAVGGEMFDRICEKGKYTEQDGARTMTEVFSAIKYLHDRDIVHRDIKPENLLYLDRSPDSSLVLADFGIAKQLRSQDDLIIPSAGSFGYAAPEVLMGKAHGKPCDIWSLGVVTYTLLSGYSPFRADNPNDFLAEVGDDFEPIFNQRMWKGVSVEAREAIAAMLKARPEDRPTIDQVMNMAWLRSDVGKTDDLLPNIREGFNARKKFKGAVIKIMLQRRLKSLGLADEDENDNDESTSPPESASSTSTDGSLKVNELHKARRNSSSRLSDVVDIAMLNKTTFNNA